MRFSFREITKHDIEQVTTWQYPEPYARYNGALLRSELLGFLRLRLLFRFLGYDCFAVDDEQGVLVGLFQYSKERRHTITIGLAMRPDVTGQGYGLSFVEAGLADARTRYAPLTFRLIVATFNQRAQKVYQRAGFQMLKEFTRLTPEGLEHFYKMERPASPQRSTEKSE